MPRLIWVGKDKVENHHHEAPFRLLERRYSYAASVSPLPSGERLGVRATNSTDNRIIHGDNLEALKALLPEFEGRVKCIYIDPPYNTGNENWVYNDNVNDPKIRKWLGQVVGKEDEDLSRHDKWLCMMYPRLKLLHRLSAEDGVIFVSIDDNELPTLRLLMDEIWGRNNFITSIIWQKVYAPKSSARHFSEDHDYILIYAKSAINWTPNLMPRSDKQDKAYKNLDNDPRGPWRPNNLAARNYYSKGTYSITCPGGRIISSPPAGSYWRFSEERFLELDKDKRIWWGKNGNSVPAPKIYLSEVKQGVVPQTLWTYSEVGHTQDAKKELLSILDFEKSEDVFITPKPSKLIERILHLATDRDSIILDSFAGSGTTAHAVLKLNAQDGGNRRFILVEMMDYAETITAERVRRVISGYGEGSRRVEGLGGGFEYFTIGPALFHDDGNLNEAVGIAAIRDYVAYTEGIPAEKRVAVLTPNSSSEGRAERISEGFSPYFLGRANEADYFFYYEPEQATTLDYAFLARLPAKPTSAVIYADTCALSDHFMRTHGLIFKKIPRDISRF